MFAFWALFLLLGYGCLGSLVYQFQNWFGESDPWIESLPLLGDVDAAKVGGIVTLAIGGFLIYRWLNRPRAAEMLIETEAELRKVTWPAFGETWIGTLAVIVTVAIMLLYLFASDLLLANIMPRAMGKG